MNRNKYSLDENNKLLVGAAIGIVDDYLERANALIKVGCNIICIDVANGYNEKVATIIKENYPSFDVDLFLSQTENEQGYLFPDTYYFSSTSTEEVILTFKKHFEEKTKDLRHN
jgi:cell division protein YceG involved in septum cleavage